ncbi:MAG: phosphate ABC transporter permease PstA [Chthoniobacteraceae bacterium]|nr:phosphate ABC transporter permease PstA [Chthoniobacteraceae bacterium]
METTLPLAQTVANPFTHRRSPARLWEGAFRWAIRLGAYAVLLAAACIFLQIGIKGGQTVFTSHWPFVNVAFFTEKPSTLYVFDWQGQKLELSDPQFRAFQAKHPGVDLQPETYAHSAGGILPCIVGTALLVAGSMTIALFLGVASAIYLSEYSRPSAALRVIRLAIMNLAGVPSIVFGLFGAALFVTYFQWNVSLLAGWFTLAFMVLPVVITSSEEALKAVPQGFREASLALGATKWQTIRTNVLPYAIPGILTSSILGIARVAGETAPILFTAAYVVRDNYPWEVDKWTDFFFQPVQALPYHIYVVSSKIPQNAYTERMQYGTAFVFLGLVLLISLGSVLLRLRLREKLKW